MSPVLPGRIVYITDRFPGIYQTFVETEIRELIRQGIHIRIFVRAGGNVPRIPEDLDDVTTTLPERRGRIRAFLRILVNYPSRTLGALGWSLGVLRHEREALRALADAAFIAPEIQELDHVHAQFAHGSASVALALGRLTRRPFSFTAHAYDILVAGNPRVMGQKIAEARFVVAVSEFTRELMASWARPDDNRKLVVVRNGIDLTAFSYDESPRTRSGPPLVLTICRLVEKKGVDTAVRACAVLAERGVHHQWEVIGDGPRRAELERLATELGVGDRVRFSGFEGPAEIRASLKAATAFALPCRVAPNGDHDVLPVAIVEALAAGVPVVTTPIGGIPEVAIHERSALIVPSEDPDALADAVARVLTDEPLRRRLIQGGLAVAAGFDKARTAARLIELFAEGPR